MTAILRAGFLASGVLFLIALGADAEFGPGTPILGVVFETDAKLPPDIAQSYVQLSEDSKLAGVGQPKILSASMPLGEKATQTFVRVENPLTCAANGQCEIDVFGTQDGKTERLLSTVAENVAVVPPGASDLKNIYPTIVTNVPPEYERSGVKAEFIPLKYTSGTIWNFNGQKYEIAKK
jgi:hypothetical protein